MPRYEGIVVDINTDGRAWVIIDPGRMGVPNVSAGLNRRVCHCATEGSSLTIDAVNRVGAEVGDLVSVHRDASALAKNAAFLLGIPAAAFMTGLILAGVLTYLFSFQRVSSIVVAFLCSLIGIVVGVLCFKGKSYEAPPVIDSILMRHADPILGQCDNEFPLSKGSMGCEVCSGSFFQGR